MVGSLSLVRRWIGGLSSVLFEVGRLVLRRPVLGILAVPIDPDGRLVLMRRRDTGGWCFPGGAVDWGETLEEAIRRELREETGLALLSIDRVVGTYSDPSRDPRMHAICVVVEASVPRLVPGQADRLNPAEVREVRAFSRTELPADLSFDTRRQLDDFLAGGPTRLS